MQYTQNLKAGQPLTIALSGRFFVLMDTGAADSIALRVRIPAFADEEISEARRGLKIRLADGRFTGMELTAPVDCVAVFLISESPIDVDFADGAIVTIAGQVELTRGSPGAPLSVTAVSVADAPAISANNAGPIAVGAGGAVVAAADVNTRELRIKNMGPASVAIGPAGATWAQRVIELEPGELWIDTTSANLAWSAITDTALAASVNVQRVIK